jgi:photosystem II stability/assembly factor-like uncharacterized protein
MRYRYLIIPLMLVVYSANGQKITNPASTLPNSENIYTIKKQYLETVLHNPSDKDESGADNDLERFNRWFNFAEPRCYPSGNMPRPDVLLRANEEARQSLGAGQRTSSVSVWQPLGPVNVPAGFFGIGRINCIVIDPIDTSTLYVGAACGGVWISHNGGATWTSNTDNFPSLSVADIAVNPHHTDTLYAATGDGYGYEYANDSSIFWGGLYSAGVMKSTNGGATWNTTGLSYLQSNRDIIQKLLIHPNNPNILLAATRNGIYRTSDAGATWTVVDTGHVFSMAFHPLHPDTVYAINTVNLRVSYNAGLTWQTLYPGMNSSGDRCTIAVSPVSPNSIWVLNDINSLLVSHDLGLTFNYLTSPAAAASFYGYYDRVLGISPGDSTFIISSGMNIGASVDGGYTWNTLDSSAYYIHPDNHAVAFNPGDPSTIYFGNDGGIVVTHDNGNSYTNISNGLMISQVYRMSSSRQTPYLMLAGLQDNATFFNDGTSWLISNGPFGDGMACAIYPGDDNYQIASTQYGNFAISYDGGVTFNPVAIGSAIGWWTSPVAFDANSPDTIFFGLDDIYASYDGGATLNNLTFTAPFPYGSVSLAVAPSNINVIYAADFGHLLKTTDGGVTWTDITGTLPASLAITGIAVDYKNSGLVYVTMSGYATGNKVFMSNTGGATWNNISYGLPNIPADCIAVDSSTPGALFVGTDIGAYYTDSTHPGSWAIYNTGLPNVIVDDIEINYTNYKVRAATYGRGIWECNLAKIIPSLGINALSKAQLKLYPNPATTSWQVVFLDQKQTNYTIKVSDINGAILHTQRNTAIVNAAGYASGAYNIEVIVGQYHYNLKAIKE